MPHKHLILVSVALLFLAALPGLHAEVSSFCKDNAVNLVVDGKTIINYEKCDYKCVMYKGKAFCLHKERIDAVCDGEYSKRGLKIRGGWIRVNKRCRAGCDEKTGACKGCCIKVFKFGENCYDSNDIDKCGWLKSFHEESCLNFKTCVSGRKPKEINLAVAGDMIKIPMNKIGDAERVVFEIAGDYIDGLKGENCYYAHINKQGDFNVNIFVKYPGKDYQLVYTSHVHTGVCIGCDEKLFQMSQFRRCGILFGLIKDDVKDDELAWIITGIAAQESSCRYWLKGGAFQVNGYPEKAPAKNIDCENYVYAEDVPEQCAVFVNELKSQVNDGVKHFLSVYNSIQSDGYTKIAFALFGYNRGIRTMKRALAYYTGNNLYDALVRGCKDIYNGKDMPAVDSRGNDMCTYKNGYGACYPSAVFKKLRIIASDLGGHLNSEIEKLIIC